MIDLTENELNIIQSLAQKHLSKGAEIWAFGSRTNGSNHDTSDLDIVIHPPKTQSKSDSASEFSLFKEALRDSNIPILSLIHI